MIAFFQKLYFDKKYREYFLSKIKYGSDLREKILLRLLDKYYHNKFYRDWRLSETAPHFENHSVEMFLLGFSSKPIAIGYFYRAFYSSEVIKNGDVVLDIGCGDGFFTKRFYAHKAKKIDAIDVDISAIKEAKRSNGDSKINYHLLDAVNEEFPQKKYDVIIWDGGIGHFSNKELPNVLAKIKNSLTDSGIFVGSESLGRMEGKNDHLQFFDELKDLQEKFIPYFKFIVGKEATYPLFNCDIMRREGFWRCANNINVMKSLEWQTLTN